MIQPPPNARPGVQAVQRTAALAAGLLCSLLVSTGCVADRSVAATRPAAPPSPESFAFALIGDMPYNESQVPVVEGLLAAIDADPQVQFALHVGDIKGGGERCDDALLEARHRQIAQLRKPWLYTPGDNEWTDCHRPSNGRYRPTERLDKLRRLFHAHPLRSGGAAPLPLESQATMPGHEGHVENAMFVHRRVLVATVHVPGSQNGLEPWSGLDGTDSPRQPRADRLADFKAREAAALAWLDHAFARAAEQRVAGVVLAFQANPAFEQAPGSRARLGFDAFIARLRQRTAEFARPVLVLHGDHHQHFVDRPFADDTSAPPAVRQLLRVQGWGHPWLDWVKLRADPAAPGVFSVESRSR